MVWFLYRSISNSFNIDESQISSQIIKFNLEDYEKIKSKLPPSVGEIITNANTTPTNTNPVTNSSGQ